MRRQIRLAVLAVAFLAGGCSANQPSGTAAPTLSDTEFTRRVNAFVAA